MIKNDGFISGKEGWTKPIEFWLDGRDWPGTFYADSYLGLDFLDLHNMIHTVEFSAYADLQNKLELCKQALEELYGHTIAYLQFPYKDTHDIAMSVTNAKQALQKLKEG